MAKTIERTTTENITEIRTRITQIQPNTELLKNCLLSSKILKIRTSLPSLMDQVKETKGSRDWYIWTSPRSIRVALQFHELTIFELKRTLKIVQSYVFI